MTKYEYILVDMFYKYQLYSDQIGMQEFVDEFNKRIEEEEVPAELAKAEKPTARVEVPEQVGGKSRGRPRTKV
jgi:hypothetical protein